MLEEITIHLIASDQNVVASPTVKLVDATLAVDYVVTVLAVESISELATSDVVRCLVAKNRETIGDQRCVIPYRAICKFEAINSTRPQHIIGIEAGQPHYVTVVAVGDEQHMAAIAVRLEAQAIA